MNEEYEKEKSSSIAVDKNGKIKEIIINKTEKPNSYEFGKAGNRFKLYFEDIKDLENQIKQLKEKGLYKEE
ncbi:MAG: hypothetical protein ACP6IY_22555 [Promethearchaeia archaeon]